MDPRGNLRVARHGGRKFQGPTASRAPVAAHSTGRHPMSDHNSFPDSLRWQLRALRQDQAPTTELWPGIAERLQPRDIRSRRQPRWVGGLALAASLLLVVGTAVWLKPAPVGTSAPVAATQ